MTCLREAEHDRANHSSWTQRLGHELADARANEQEVPACLLRLGLLWIFGPTTNSNRKDQTRACRSTCIHIPPNNAHHPLVLAPSLFVFPAPIRHGCGRHNRGRSCEMPSGAWSSWSEVSELVAVFREELLVVERGGGSISEGIFTITMLGGGKVHHRCRCFHTG